jgi:hypothetical protein
MRRLMATTILALAVGALANCASQPPPAPPPTANLSATEGTIAFSGGAVAVGVGFQWGNGTLTYKVDNILFEWMGCQ